MLSLTSVERRQIQQGRVNVRRVVDSVFPSPLQGRVAELLRQSRDYKTELSRITDDLERLQARIHNIGAPTNSDCAVERENESPRE